MARVTVEDCIDKVENRFDLVLLASHRARMISSGGQIAVERDNDKNPVVALREIAEKAVSPEDLKEELVHSLQKYEMCIRDRHLPAGRNGQRQVRKLDFQPGSRVGVSASSRCLRTCANTSRNICGVSTPVFVL